MKLREAIVSAIGYVVGELPSESDTLGQRIATHSSRWKDIQTSLEQAGSPIAVDVEWGLNAAPHGFSRLQVIRASGPTAADTERRRLIAGLMWGYGKQGLRYKKTAVAMVDLLSAPKLDEHLERVRMEVESGNVGGAYKAMPYVKGYGPSFLTKHLYFTGRAAAPETAYPLILDAMVARSLAQVCGLSEAVSLGSYWPRRDATAFAGYVEAMHDASNEIGCSADSLEQYLWKPGPGFSAACS